MPELSARVLAIAPGATPFTILGRERGAERTYSHDELLDAVAERAAGLAEHDVERGDVVALFAHATFDFVVGCFAAWRRGCAVATLPLPPRLASRRGWTDHVTKILRASGARALLRGEQDPPFDSHVPAIDSVSLTGGGPFDDDGPSPRDVALIQFTSGSTSAPKGIVLEHGAVVASVAALTRRFGSLSGEDNARFSWLPLHHDLGFVDYVLQPLTQAWPAVLMPTESFVAEPVRWVEEMSARRAASTSAPSSAYGFVARELEKGHEMSLDLSGWRWAGNGGEPIDPGTLDRFSAAAARWGFDPRAHAPGWGLAEATCAVTAPSPQYGARVDRVGREALARGEATPAASDVGAVEIVNVGWALDGYEVAITGPSGDELPDRHVGEIVVRAPSVMRGYLGDDDATAAAFRDGWLLTGDVGYLVDGSLHVTGRIKDVIIVDGANYHASDIERIVEKVPGVRAGGCAAVAVRRDGSERLGVIAETRVAPEAAAVQKRAVQTAVLEATGVSPALVSLVAPRSLPKTTSGKLRRGEVRRMLEAGELVDVERPAANVPAEASHIETRIAEIWRQVLGVDRIEPGDDFFELGGSSLQAATVVAEIETRLRVPLPLSALATTPTLGALAARVARGGEVRSESIVRLRHAEAGPDLFAFPGGAGGVLDYRRLANELEGHCSFYAFDPRGGDARSRPAGSVEEMADQCLREMRGRSPGPYVLIGYSFGGIVAYEVAARLAADGFTGTRLVMLDAPVPRKIRPPDFHAGRRRSVVDLYRQGRQIAARPVVRALAGARIRLRAPVPLRMFQRYLLTNARALSLRYVPPPYSGPVDYVEVQIDDVVPADKHVRVWRTVASDLRTHRVAAPSHLHVLVNPWVEELAAIVRAVLSEAPVSDHAGRRE